jgi:hypothetical protein
MFGKKIYDKILAQMQPEFQDETPVNVFDFWAGANFKLKICQVEGYRNYDKSGFDKQAELSKDDKKLEQIYNSLYSLADFVDPKTFKTYAELEAKMHLVLGTTPTGAPIKAVEQKSVGKTATAKAFDTAKEEEDEDKPEVKASAVAQVTEEEDDDTLSYFTNLAKKK